MELADILVHVISKPLDVDGGGQVDAQMLDIELALRRALSSKRARASWGKARSAVVGLKRLVATPLPTVERASTPKDVEAASRATTLPCTNTPPMTAQ